MLQELIRGSNTALSLYWQEGKSQGLAQTEGGRCLESSFPSLRMVLKTPDTPQPSKSTYTATNAQI